MHGANNTAMGVIRHGPILSSEALVVLWSSFPPLCELSGANRLGECQRRLPPFLFHYVDSAALQTMCNYTVEVVMRKQKL